MRCDTLQVGMKVMKRIFPLFEVFKFFPALCSEDQRTGLVKANICSCCLSCQTPVTRHCAQQGHDCFYPIGKNTHIHPPPPNSSSQMASNNSAGEIFKKNIFFYLISLLLNLASSSGNVLWSRVGVVSNDAWQRAVFAWIFPSVSPPKPDRLKAS